MTAGRGARRPPATPSPRRLRRPPRPPRSRGPRRSCDRAGCRQPVRLTGASGPCRATAVTVPRTVPVTFERPVLGRYGTGWPSTLHPAAAARSTISSGHPERRSVRPRSSRSSRRATRMGPRSLRPSPVRRRTSRASTRLARRAWSGHAPRSAWRSPITRSARPSSTAVASPGRSAGSQLASASRKATTSAEATDRPDQHAAPKPRVGSMTTCAPCWRATVAVSSVEPLSTTMAR